RQPFHRGGDAGIDRAVRIAVVRPHAIAAAGRCDPVARPAAAELVGCADAGGRAGQGLQAVPIDARGTHASEGADTRQRAVAIDHAGASTVDVELKLAVALDDPVLAIF